MVHGGWNRDLQLRFCGEENKKTTKNQKSCAKIETENYA